MDVCHLSKNKKLKKKKKKKKKKNNTPAHNFSFNQSLIRIKFCNLVNPHPVSLKGTQLGNIFHSLCGYTNWAETREYMAKLGLQNTVTLRIMVHFTFDANSVLNENLGGILSDT
jgi:hypothetical protein